MRLVAPAKINLCLRVGKPREDGFHPLVSWMISVGLFDTLTFERARRDGLSLSCDVPGLVGDQQNLVEKAAAALVQDSTRRIEEGSVVGGVLATLDKRIPVGAGLGGGSSDAARTLLGLNRLWKLGLRNEELGAIAARLGSDVPFFLHLPSSICTGRGEIVRPVPPPTVKWCLLVLPAYSIATPAVYKRLDELGLGARLDNQPSWEKWSGLDAEQLLKLLVNDLETPAFSIRPELGELREAIERKLSRIVRMSGSGSSLFSLFDFEQQAKLAAEKVVREFQIRAICVELAPELRDDLDDDR
jgi:4-diphosphocytidyl-2-C-methyl-D-erythritol kinase